MKKTIVIVLLVLLVSAMPMFAQFFAVSVRPDWISNSPWKNEMAKEIVKQKKLRYDYQIIRKIVKNDELILEQSFIGKVQAEYKVNNNTPQVYIVDTYPADDPKNSYVLLVIGFLTVPVQNLQDEIKLPDGVNEVTLTEADTVAQ